MNKKSKPTGKRTPKPNNPKNKEDQDPLKVILNQRIELLEDMQTDLRNYYFLLNAPASIFNQLTPEQKKEFQLSETSSKTNIKIDTLSNEIDDFFRGSKQTLPSKLKLPPPHKNNLKVNLEILIKQCLFTIEYYKSINGADSNVLRGLEKGYFGFLKNSYWLIGACEQVINERAIKSNYRNKSIRKKNKHMENAREILLKHNNEINMHCVKEIASRTGLGEPRARQLAKDLVKERT